MATTSPSRFGLGSTVWIIVVAAVTRGPRGDGRSISGELSLDPFDEPWRKHRRVTMNNRSTRSS